MKTRRPPSLPTGAFVIDLLTYLSRAQTPHPHRRTAASAGGDIGESQLMHNAQMHVDGRCVKRSVGQRFPEGVDPGGERLHESRDGGEHCLGLFLGVFAGGQQTWRPPGAANTDQGLDELMLVSGNA
jgi:hypothetical protein